MKVEAHLLATITYVTSRAEDRWSITITKHLKNHIQKRSTIGDLSFIPDADLTVLVVYDSSLHHAVNARWMEIKILAETALELFDAEPCVYNNLAYTKNDFEVFWTQFSMWNKIMISKS